MLVRVLLLCLLIAVSTTTGKRKNLFSISLSATSIKYNAGIFYSLEGSTIVFISLTAFDLDVSRQTEQVVKYKISAGAF